MEFQFLFESRIKIEIHFMFKTKIEDKYSDTSKIVLSFLVE